MNIIRSIPSDNNSVICPFIEGSERIKESYADYLHDESRLSEGTIKAIFFPSSTLEVSSALEICSHRDWKTGISGGRTGIVGGAVALDVDAIISLDKMQQITSIGKDYIAAEAGIRLDKLNEYISLNIPKMFYPVDPTEMTASFGGSVATNASGARTYYYGPTRNWVNAITVVLTNDSILKLRRGEIFAHNRSFQIEIHGKKSSMFDFPYFEYPKTKNTAGYELRAGMDAIDLFIGSEGTLGVITEVEIKLIPKLENHLYSVIWTKSEQQTLEIVRELKKTKKLKILSLEYFDPNSLILLCAKRMHDGSESAIPKFPDDAVAALFLDFFYDEENDCLECAEELEKILMKFGLSSDNTWSGLEEKDLTQMKAFRHALPETVNEIISQRKAVNPKIHKLSTDLAVPEGKLCEMLSIYRSMLEKTGIEHVIFGHIGDNHLHMNMLPKSEEELDMAKLLYRELAVESVRLGGTVAAEHGIGRLKRDLMRIQYPREILEKMWELKRIFDPKEIINPGVLLPDL